MEASFFIDSKTIKLLIAIGEQVGEVKANHLIHPERNFKKKAFLERVHSAIALDGNVLSFDQFKALTNHYLVNASPIDIQEAKNALDMYDALPEYHYTSLSDFKKLLQHLKSNSPEQVSAKNNFSGETNEELEWLFSYLTKNKDHSLLKSCIFHFYFLQMQAFQEEHFSIALLWQKLILMDYHPFFEFIALEKQVRNKQAKYKGAIEKTKSGGEALPLIHFLLQSIHSALEIYLRTQKITLTSDDRMALFIQSFEGEEFVRQDYLRKFKNISAVTASRDLKEAVNSRLLLKKGDKRLATYKLLTKA